MKNFLRDGYVILRNSINRKDFKYIQNIAFEALNIKKKTYKNLLKSVQKSKKSSFDYTLPIHKKFVTNDVFSKVLLQKKIFSFLSNQLGRDLSHHDDPSVTLNMSSKNDSEKNYHFKNWHQELWSGASTSTLALWTPIIHHSSKLGQVEFVKGSHLWGHVPHRNRKLIVIPKKYNMKKINLEYGDVIIFHSLLLHRSSSMISNKFNARVSLVAHVKNFKNDNIAFNINKDWKIFSRSELTKIEMKLGNHFLSPFRTQE